MSFDGYLESFSLEADDGSADTRPTLRDAVAVGGRSLPRYTNAFWTSGQRQSHSLHEVSYRACFKAELPRFFIGQLTRPGDLVYDPFMGRGTTLLEAALMDRRVAGNDVNPLARILLEPRLSPPTLEQVRDRLAEIPWGTGSPADIDLSMFYSPATLGRIMALRGHLQARMESGNEDATDRWIRMVATNRLTGHSPGFFSVYTMPPNQAVSAETQRKINARRNQTPPDRDVAAIILKKSKALLANLDAATRQRMETIGREARFTCLPAQDASPLEAGSVSLVVTSPPFLDVVQYEQDNWLRCWFNGLDAKQIGRSITMSKSVGQWGGVMRSALDQLKRLLKPGGWIAFEVGEVRGGKVRLDEAVAPLGIEAGLECRGIMVNDQHFTKTANCWGISNNARGTNTNRIVLFQKTLSPVATGHCQH